MQIICNPGKLPTRVNQVNKKYFNTQIRKYMKKNKVMQQNTNWYINNNK